jgi:hypothetical protein
MKNFCFISCVFFAFMINAGCSKSDSKNNTVPTPVPPPTPNMMTDIVGVYKGTLSRTIINTWRSISHPEPRVDTIRERIPGFSMTITRVDNSNFFINWTYLALNDTIKYQGLSYSQDNSVDRFVNTRELSFFPDRDSMNCETISTLEFTDAFSNTRYETYDVFHGTRN